MKGWRKLAALSLSAALCGCAPEYLPVDAAGHRTAMPPAPSPPASEAAPAPAPPSDKPSQTPAAPAANDTCGAHALAYLIGKPKTEIPIPTDLSRRRVTCTTCAVTQDYRPDRLTIYFDAQTGIVQSLKCG